MPAKVDELFDEVKKNNPSYSDEQAWATAWSIYCKHVEPKSESCHMPTSEYLKGKSAAERVAARFLGKTASRDGKMVGNGWRLTWSDYQFMLEELPAKGKRKLQVAELRNPYYHTKFDAWLPVNVLSFYGKVSPSDSFEGVKDKIVAAITSEKALADVKGHASPGYDPMKDLAHLKWYTNEVHFLQVVPENVEPFTAKGKDFTVSCKWLEFKAYSPSSYDDGGGDPHYTIIKSTAPTSARKLYQTLKANPDALKSVPWGKFDEWLKANKMNYEYQHSVWH